jgi:4-diphosphocytidyl-2-C-methyl-D-erythritol kinase
MTPDEGSNRPVTPGAEAGGTTAPGGGSGRAAAPRGGSAHLDRGSLHVVRFAPAKLNLTLALTGRRADGYHALHSVMVPLSLGDALTASVAPAGAPGDTLRVTGLPVSTAADNLVLRAVAAARDRVASSWPGAPAAPPLLATRLVKRIPVAAGLGGGSSDAAAAIDAALTAWGAALEPAERLELAASLGSDVPFFLAGGAALVTGRGEYVDPLPDLGGAPPAVLLVRPGVPVPTASVFRAFDGGMHAPDAGRALRVSERLVIAMKAGLPAAELLDLGAELALANDLAPAAASVVAGFGAYTRALERLVDRPVCLSGSGPTLWVLYPTLAEARKATRFVRLAAVNGTLPLVGTGEPFITATTIVSRSAPPATQPAGRTTGTIRPRTVHNGSYAGEGPA